MRSKRIFFWLLGCLFAIGIGVLLATAIRSGVYYQLDQDELAHANVSYLLLHGLVPYRQFFMTYTPVFHFLLSPIFLFAGYSLQSMTLARWVMVLMFLLRIAGIGWIAVRVFGKRVAVVSILLLLLNPISTYTAMQIRPDNLMMLLFTYSLVFLIHGSYFLSGILLSASALVLIKIVPSAAVILSGVLWYGVTKHKKQKVKIFLLGCLIPVLIFFGYTTASGTTNEMIQEVIRDSYAINQSVAFPIPITHFLSPGKSALFDIYGEAWNRLPYIELAFILLAAAGLAFTKNSSSLFRRILAGSLVFQVIALFLVHSVFIQYFLPITWLIDIFAALTIVRLSRRPILFGLFIVFLTVATYDSTRANISRSVVVTNTTLTWLTSVWSAVPEDASVYPNIPFRPISYPTTFGYYFHDLPPSVINRFPSLVATLEKNNVQYILQTYEWRALPQNFFPYVYDTFHKINSDVFIRNK